MRLTLNEPRSTAELVVDLHSSIEGQDTWSTAEYTVISARFDLDQEDYAPIHDTVAAICQKELVIAIDDGLFRLLSGDSWARVHLST